MRPLMQRLKRLWNTPVEFYGVDRPEPQAGPWHGLMLFVVLLVIMSLLWLVKYLPERTYLVESPQHGQDHRYAGGEVRRLTSTPPGQEAMYPGAAARVQGEQPGIERKEVT
jgi:hypothetical protein